MKKFVVLEHLTGPDKGFRFWTINRGEDSTLCKGRVAYAVILETDSKTEATETSRKTNWNAVNW